MSKYLDLNELEISDQKLLVETLLSDMKYASRLSNIEVESHESPVSLFGFTGDLRPEVAEVVVRRKYVGPSANDVGFHRQPNGNFKPVISQFDSINYNRQWLTQLSDRYAERKFGQDMYQQGFRLAGRTVEQDGAVSLEFERIGGI